MRKATLVLLSVSLVTNAFAQGAGAPPAAIAKPSANDGRPNIQTPFTGILPTVVAQPGQFDIHSGDVTVLLQETLKRYADVQDKDREYLDSVVKEMITVVNDYQTYITAGPWKQLSDRSISSGAKQVTLQEFLATLNEVRQKKLALQTKLDLLTSVSSALPSDVQTVDGKSNNPLPQPRKIDFSGVVAAATKNLAAAEAIANNLQFAVVNVNPDDPTDVRPPLLIPANSGTALNPVINSPLLSRKQIDNLQAQARGLVTFSRSFNSATQTHADLLKQLIWKFRDRFGKEEAYRFHDAAFSEARAAAFKDIANMFWQRSYLRKVYGVRVGSILPENYNKRYMNIDRFTVLLDQLSQFKETSSPLDIDDASILSATEDFRQTLITLGDKTAGILTGDASILARINSAYTWFRGERPTAEALLMIVQMLAADLYEEKALAMGTGLQEVTRFFDARWEATPQDKQLHEERVCAFDSISNIANGRQNCFQGTAQSGLLGAFVVLNDELNSQSAGIDQANDIRKQIQLAIMATTGGQKNGAAGRRG